MSFPERLVSLVGDWTGMNRLWLSPDDPVRESSTSLTVALRAQGQFLSFQYDWADGDSPQDGLLVLGIKREINEADAFWVDSWHTQEAFMRFQGHVENGSDVTLNGSYPAGSRADWGWRIGIAPKTDGTLQLVMHNIPPSDEEHLAVQAIYSRVAAGPTD